MVTLIAFVAGFYFGGVACALQWGFVITDEDGEEIDGTQATWLRIQLALTWFWSWQRREHGEE